MRRLQEREWREYTSITKWKIIRLGSNRLKEETGIREGNWPNFRDSHMARAKTIKFSLYNPNHDLHLLIPHVRNTPEKTMHCFLCIKNETRVLIEIVIGKWIRRNGYVAYKTKG